MSKQVPDRSAVAQLWSTVSTRQLNDGKRPHSQNKCSHAHARTHAVCQVFHFSCYKKGHSCLFSSLSRFSGWSSLCNQAPLCIWDWLSIGISLLCTVCIDGIFFSSFIWKCPHGAKLKFRFHIYQWFSSHSDPSFPHFNFLCPDCHLLDRGMCVLVYLCPGVKISHHTAALRAEGW